MTQTEVVSASNKDIAPYGEYKDSGVPWLGEIPAHWEVPRLGSMIRFRNLRNHPDMPLLSVVRERGVIPRSAMSDDENHNFIPDDLSNYKVVVTGDLVINKMKAWQGSLGIASQGGIVSPAYYVLELNNVNKDFSHRQLRSKPFVHMFARASDGVRIGQWDLSPEQLKRIPIPLPPLDEQAAIVKYLAHVDRKIDRFVRAKRRLIALLEEQKQALIHQAVTKGLDPDVPMKDSGVEWLGEIPAHWEVKRGKTLYRKLERPASDDLDVVTCFRDGQVTLRKNRRTTGFTEAIKEVGYQGVEIGDLVIHAMDAFAGAIGVSDSAGKCTPMYAVCEAKVPINNYYVSRVLREMARSQWIAALATGIRERSTDFRFAAFAEQSLPVPPKSEQDDISAFLDQSVAEVKTAIERSAKEIDLIREYRTRLVSDVVTGKLDVREAAASLPEIEDEPDEMDVQNADDEEGDEVGMAMTDEEIDEA